MLKADVFEDKSKDDKVLEEFASCFQKTTVEYHRLNQHPELFESKMMREAFRHDIMLIMKYMKYKTTGEEDIQKLRTDITSSAEKEFQRKVLPSQDEHRRPWQQFLHNNAPGSGVDLSNTPDNAVIRVLPKAAMRILDSWHKDFSNTHREVSPLLRYECMLFTCPADEFGIQIFKVNVRDEVRILHP